MAARAGSKKANQKAGSGGDGRPLNGDDNHKAILDAEKAQLISIVAKIMAQKPKTAAAKAAYEIERDVETENFRLGKAAGFARKELEGYIEDLSTRAKDLVEAEERRRRHRDALGLPTGGQFELFNGDSPIDVKDDAFARADGYAAYHRNMPCTPPDDVGARFVQSWIKGWQDGQTATAWAMSQTGDAPAVEKFTPVDPTAGMSDMDAEAFFEGQESDFLRAFLSDRGVATTDAADHDDLVDYALEAVGRVFEAPDEEIAGQTDRQAVVAAHDTDDLELPGFMKQAESEDEAVG